MPTEIESVGRLGEFVGREVALGEWVGVSQGRIDRFAEATEDRQWIHTEPERAARESPFKQTVAHGFLTLSLLSELMRLAVSVGGVRMGINYGLNRVRFVAPVPAGSRLRARFSPAAVEESGGGIQVTWSAAIECEHSDKPSCIAEWVVRYFPER